MATALVSRQNARIFIRGVGERRVVQWDGIGRAVTVVDVDLGMGGPPGPVPNARLPKRRG